MIHYYCAAHMPRAPLQHPFDLTKDPRAGFRLQHEQDTPYFGLVERSNGVVFYGPRRCDCIARILALLRIQSRALRVVCVQSPDLATFLEEPIQERWRVLQWPSNTLLSLPNCTAGGPRADRLGGSSDWGRGRRSMVPLGSLNARRSLAEISGV